MHRRRLLASLAGLAAATAGCAGGGDGDDGGDSTETTWDYGVTAGPTSAGGGGTAGPTGTGGGSGTTDGSGGDTTGATTDAQGGGGTTTGPTATGTPAGAEGPPQCGPVDGESTSETVESSGSSHPLDLVVSNETEIERTVTVALERSNGQQLLEEAVTLPAGYDRTIGEALSIQGSAATYVASATVAGGTCEHTYEVPGDHTVHRLTATVATDPLRVVWGAQMH